MAVACILHNWLPVMNTSTTPTSAKVDQVQLAAAEAGNMGPLLLLATITAVLVFVRACF